MADPEMQVRRPSTEQMFRQWGMRAHEECFPLLLLIHISDSCRLWSSQKGSSGQRLAALVRRNGHPSLAVPPLPQPRPLLHPSLSGSSFPQTQADLGIPPRSTFLWLVLISLSFPLLNILIIPTRNTFYFHDFGGKRVFFSIGLYSHLKG